MKAHTQRRSSAATLKAALSFFLTTTLNRPYVVRMGRPASISTNCLQMMHARRRSSSSSPSAERTLRRRSSGMAASVLLLVLLAVCVGMSSAYSSGDDNVDSELIETETGWQFDEDIEPFDNATAPAPAPAAKVKGNTVPIINGDFEMANVTGNASVLADATATTMIPNWLPGGAGVQVIQAATYKMSSFAKSLFAIHLNNPAAVGNGTQGLIATTLAVNPATGKTFTVQYDCARMPDGPINLLSTLKVSSISGTTTNQWELHKVKYNATDTVAMMTWQRQSFVYTGTGAATKIQFESMSEKYGPAIDNVVILTGSHVLAGAPSAHLLSLWQRWMTPVFAVAMVVAFHSPLVSSTL